MNCSGDSAPIDTVLNVMPAIAPIDIVLNVMPAIAPIDTVLNVMPAIATKARPIKCGLLRLLIIIMKPCGRKFVVALYLPRNHYPKPAMFLSNNVA